MSPIVTVPAHRRPLTHKIVWFGRWWRSNQPSSPVSAFAVSDSNGLASQYKPCIARLFSKGSTYAPLVYSFAKSMAVVIDIHTVTFVTISSRKFNCAVLATDPQTNAALCDL